MLKKINEKQIILASQSPRRQFLLREMGIDFTLAPKRDIDERYPAKLSKSKIAIHISEKKAKAYADLLTSNNVIITADTLVFLRNEVIGKPESLEHASELLLKLSGKKHEVITGVTLSTLKAIKSFQSRSEVTFKNLTDSEIAFYLNKFKPLDKAGAYGIQEWIGYIAIRHVKGSFYNVMGLPTQQLYEELGEILST